MADAWTPEKRQLLLKGAAATVVLIVIFFAIGLLQNRGPTRCESILISEAKDDCWKQVAKETGDASYCRNITSPSLHDQCIQDLSVSSTGGSCGMMAQQLARDYCYANLARSEDNETYCGLATTSTIRDSCYSALASSLSSPSLCGRISDRDSQMSCNNNLYLQLAVSQKNVSLCRNMMTDNMSYHSYLVDTCIIQVVANSTDKSACSSISNATLRSQCATPPLGFESCASMEDDNSMNICFYAVATGTDDPDNCDRIPSQSLRDNCYYQFAARLGDRSICNRIVSENMRSLCQTGAGG